MPAGSFGEFYHDSNLTELTNCLISLEIALRMTWNFVEISGIGQAIEKIIFFSKETIMAATNPWVIEARSKNLLLWVFFIFIFFVNDYVMFT